jgi:hypothetical protein
VLLGAGLRKKVKAENEVGIGRRSKKVSEI